MATTMRNSQVGNHQQALIDARTARYKADKLRLDEEFKAAVESLPNYFGAKLTVTKKFEKKRNVLFAIFEEDIRQLKCKEKSTQTTKAATEPVKRAATPHPSVPTTTAVITVSMKKDQERMLIATGREKKQDKPSEEVNARLRAKAEKERLVPPPRSQALIPWSATRSTPTTGGTPSSISNEIFSLHMTAVNDRYQEELRTLTAKHKKTLDEFKTHNTEWDKTKKQHAQELEDFNKQYEEIFKDLQNTYNQRTEEFRKLRGLPNSTPAATAQPLSIINGLTFTDQACPDANSNQAGQRFGNR